jgi:alanine dehydrogenase
LITLSELLVSEPTLAISEAEVVELLDLSGAVEELERGFLEEATGDTIRLEKTVVSFGGHSTLHALGAASVRAGIVGTKTWTHTPGGADPRLLLFDAADGRLLALIESFALGQLRTSGTVAVATARLAADEAGTLGVVGTGRQALAQVAAVHTVRPLRSVRVFSPSEEHRTVFAGLVRETLGLDCAAVGSAAAAADGAEIITLVTRATSPFLSSEMVSSGTHVNACGAITAERAEFEPDLLSRCTSIVTDSPVQARESSAEFRDYFDGPGRSWSQVRSLADVVAGGTRRSGESDVTLFKAMGSGVEDLALGMVVYQRAKQAGLGRPLPRGARTPPRLWASDAVQDRRPEDQTRTGTFG